MTNLPPATRQRMAQGLTSFAIAILSGMGIALYVCTARPGSVAWSPGMAVTVGLGSCAVAFVLMLVVGLGSMGAGLRDAARQRAELPAGTPITTPGWMGLTVKLRAALAYAIYVALGFAMGGGMAALLRSVND